MALVTASLPRARPVPRNIRLLGLDPRVGLLCLALALAPLSRAGELAGNLGVASDDVFRGQSQSDGQISAQGDLHVLSPEWYVGLSAEEVKRSRSVGAGAEVIAYAGAQQRIGDNWTVGETLRHYDYPGNPRRSQYRYDELGATLGWRQRLLLSVIASPDSYAVDYEGHHGRGAAFCYELGVRQPLPLGLTAGAGVGYYDLRREVGVGYAYWSAGVERQWGAWGVDLRYIGTDSTAMQHFGDQAGNRVVLTALWSF